MGYLLLITPFLLLTACNTGAKIDSQKVAEEMRNRKIVHANQAEITEGALAEGSRLAGWLDKRLIQTLEAAPDQKNIVAWAARCNPRALSVDSLGRAHYTAIQRVALKADAKKAALTGKALQVWEAYRYNAENKLPMDPNIQRDGEAYLLYTSPILLSNATCLKCHGEVGKDLSESNFRALKNTYPAMDSLINYQVIQPIGTWNLRFDKNRLIQRIKTR